MISCIRVTFQLIPRFRLNQHNTKRRNDGYQSEFYFGEPEKLQSM